MEQLKDKLLSSFIVLENDLGTEKRSPLFAMRKEALASFEKMGFPTKRMEEWKYTNLRPVLKHDYKIFPSTEESIEYRDVRQYFLHDLDTYKVVFINGIYSSWLSETTHQNFDVCTYGAALKKYPEVLEAYLGKNTPNTDAMIALNTAFARDGAFIRIKKNQVVDKPIQIVFLNTSQDREVFIQPRNLVILEENAQAQITERHQSLSELPVFSNSVTEIFAHKNAHLDFYKLQNDQLTAGLVDNTHISLERDSVVKVHTFCFGGKLTRNNLNFYLKGENARADMNGITILNENQHADHHTLADHQVPHCESNEMYKGIYNDQSKGVFNGKIIVRQDAQKTNAFQQNNNILLSDKASVDTKPQLEIFADDVKCSHGCTVGQLDEEALFYLQARGIPKKEAEAMLMYAFSSEILRDVKIPELSKKLNIQIAKKLGVDLDFVL